MNILFLTLLDFKSIQDHNIYADLMREFVHHGHKVHIISPVERRLNQATALVSEENAQILKLRIGNTQKTNIIEKGISTLTIESHFIKGIKQYFNDVKFDLVIYSTPPITFCNAIKYVKKRDGAKTYLLLKDIFPQNAVDLGLMSKTGFKGTLYQYFRNKEKALYAISDRIGCMSQANVDYVIKHNPEVNPEKVEICPNCIEVIDKSVDEEQRRAIREKYKIPLDKKVFIYGGNLGKPQGIDFIIECLRKGNQMPKICYVVTIPSTIRAFFVSQLKYLAFNGFDVTVICSHDDALLEELGSEIKYYPVKIPRGISSTSMLSAIHSLRKYFIKEKFDIVQYSTPNAALCAAIAGKLSGVRVRNYHLMGFRYLGSSGIGKMLLKSIERITCALSTHIECVSSSNLEMGTREKIFDRKKATVVWHGSTGGVNLSRFDISRREEWRVKHRRENNWLEGDIVVGFVGRITKDKGIVELLNAFFDIGKDVKHVKLSLIGVIENADKGIPFELIDEAKKNTNISFIDYVSAVEEYYPMLDLLVLPSYREGFGNVVIEAEAMGVPVIVSAIPGPLDTMIPGETGLTCEVKDERDLEEKLMLLIENQELRETYGYNAHKYVKDNFDSETLNRYILMRKEFLIKAAGGEML